MVTHWELRFLKVAVQMIQKGAGVSSKLEKQKKVVYTIFPVVKTGLLSDVLVLPYPL